MILIQGIAFFVLYNSILIPKCCSSLEWFPSKAPCCLNEWCVKEVERIARECISSSYSTLVTPDSKQPLNSDEDHNVKINKFCELLRNDMNYMGDNWDATKWCKNCGDDVCFTTDEGYRCRVPFEHNNKLYYKCTTDGKSKPWCRYGTDKTNWGNCSKCVVDANSCTQDFRSYMLEFHETKKSMAETKHDTKVIGGLVARLYKETLTLKTQQITWIKDVDENEKENLRKTLEKLGEVEKRIVKEMEKINAQTIKRMDDLEKLLKEQQDMKSVVTLEVLGLERKTSKHFKNLDTETQDILDNQLDILIRMEDIKIQIENLAQDLDKFEDKFEQWKVEDFYMTDLKALTGSIRAYRINESIHSLPRDEFGILDKASLPFAAFVKDIILRDKFSETIDNIFMMIIGDEFPRPAQSIYQISESYCDIKIHQKLMELLSEGKNIFEFVNGLDSAIQEIIDPLLTNFHPSLSQFREKFVKKAMKADESYALHCKCPTGFHKYQSKRISQLLPTLETSTSTKLQNYMKLSTMRMSHITRLKVDYILKNHGNFEVSIVQIKKIALHSDEDIKLAMKLEKQELDHILQAKEGEISCILERNNFEQCDINGKKGDGSSKGSCEDDELCHSFGCESRCPIGWISTSNGIQDDDKVLDNSDEMSLHECADKCYFDQQCQAFMYCKENCDDSWSFEPYQQHCIMVPKKLVSSSSNKKNFVSCEPEEWFDKIIIGLWRRMVSGKSVRTRELACIHTIDSKLKCDGKDVLLHDDRTIVWKEMQGKFDGNKTITWSNNEIWIKDGPLAYKCYEYTSSDFKWKDFHNKTNKEMCERHEGHYFPLDISLNDIVAPGCHKNCQCCKVLKGMI